MFRCFLYEMSEQQKVIYILSQKIKASEKKKK